MEKQIIDLLALILNFSAALLLLNWSTKTGGIARITYAWEKEFIVQNLAEIKMKSLFERALLLLVTGFTMQIAMAVQRLGQ